MSDLSPRAVHFSGGEEEEEDVQVQVQVVVVEGPESGQQQQSMVVNDMDADNSSPGSEEDANAAEGQDGLGSLNLYVEAAPAQKNWSWRF